MVESWISPFVQIIGCAWHWQALLVCLQQLFIKVRSKFLLVDYSELRDAYPVLVSRADDFFSILHGSCGLVGEEEEVLSPTVFPLFPPSPGSNGVPEIPGDAPVDWNLGEEAIV